jgi:hypothetical protein
MSAMSRSNSKPRLHVTIEPTAMEPQTTFMEKIHTPHHSNPHPNMSIEEWDSEKHAHIASEVTSPHGTVKRPLTPIRPAGDTAFQVADAAEGNALVDEERARQANAHVAAVKGAKKVSLPGGIKINADGAVLTLTAALVAALVFGRL